MADADRLTLSLSSGGDVVIRLRPDLAPGHVQRITELASQGFYDGVLFHRVIPGFMAQGGDPTGTGSGGSQLPDLKAEFNAEPHVRGTCSMARTPNPDSANSQFFICFGDATFLDQGLAPATPWIECTAPILNQRLLQGSPCLAVVSGAAGRYYEELGLLKRLPLALKYDVGPVGMAWGPDDDSPALQLVLQALRAVGAEIAGQHAPAARRPKPRAARPLQ